MKKNIQINLFGTLYNIDEDACQLLENYLESMRRYFSNREGGAEIAKQVTCGVVPVIGSIYVEQYLDDFSLFRPAVEQALKSTEGVMVFDIVHLNKHHLWGDLEAAMKNAGNLQ